MKVRKHVGAVLLLLAMVLLIAQQTPGLVRAGQPPPATNTPRGTVASSAPTATLVPSSPVATATKGPMIGPTLPPGGAADQAIVGTYTTPGEPLITAIPPAMETPTPSGDDVVVVALLGSDTITPDAAARTDVIVLAAIDRTKGTVSLAHIPRDLLVYVPNYTMTKINIVFNYGDVKYGRGGGGKLMKDTILYNLGVKVDFYARVNFVEFQKLVQKLGGLDISVDCAIQGYKLKDPKLPYNDPASWELYTLPVGEHKLDPYTALWYVRSRGSSSDFDRGRREIDVLRAMWRQAKNQGLLNQITTLWPDMQSLVETDMTLPDILSFLPAGLALDESHIQRIDIALDQQVRATNLGSYVLLPIHDAMRTAMQNLVLPPPDNRLDGETPSVDVASGIALKGIDQVAADMLSWQGFSTDTLGNYDKVANRDQTVIYDYTGDAKPASLKTILATLRMKPAQVISQPDPNRTVDFHIEMGRDYSKCLMSLPLDTSSP